MLCGKICRLAKILKGSENFFIIPIDHGFTHGPIAQLADVKAFIRKLPFKTINAVVAHKGLAYSIQPLLIQKDISLILHLSGSTSLSPDPSYKNLVSSVEHAIKIGADGVSIHINLGSENEHRMLKDFSIISEECDKWSMPLLAMVYPRGNKIKNEYDPDVVAHATRLAWELGADIVKVNYTGDIKSFRKVVSAVDIPVVIAGGPKLDSDSSILSMVSDSIKAGGRGVAFGRNIFQHTDPYYISQKIVQMVNFSSKLEFQGVGLDVLS
ncbi:MAG: 2-amino-3,7-dideoxy-D-threo-hept-6-ulosonate synthase [Scytonema sp. PMC 1069.18]|nr:2-amino-3,7-dideoxy-D-threo-hept-6-ulosonate synthase [Scytonema sp. PMC 1069.18]MEC4881331.1 2-amino-3,7-dideoxy-D-threo-hept-6-ulosonate synthase [Scytonema sp. PMC 1070.18]